MSQVVDLRKIKNTPPKETDTKTTAGASTPTKIEWMAPEFTKYKKKKNWFILPALVALAFIIIAIIFKNFLLVVGIILASFTVYIYTKKEPRKIKFSISGKGVQIDNQIYEWEDLKSFWVFYRPPEVKEISIRSKKLLMPYLKIPLGGQNPVDVRKLLLKFLPERKHKESMIDEWAKKIKF